MPSIRSLPARRPLIDTLERRLVMNYALGSIAPDVVHQTITGLGGASTGWYFAPELADASFYDLLAGDLGASGVRAAVNPNFEATNDNNDPDVFDWDNFDTAQLAHVMQFNQRMKERGATQFFMSVWTPPWWMKTNMTVNAGGSLRADMRAEYAEYLAAVVISAERDYGITLDAISIQNEQFFIESYESTVYDNIMMRETVLAVQKKFKAEGLNTRIITNEDLTVAATADRWKWYNDAILESPEIDRSQIIIAAHASDPQYMDDQRETVEGTGIPLWYTEISGYPDDWTGAMDTARDLSDTLTKANAEAYYYWLYNYTGVFNGTASLLNNGVPNSKYYGLKHYYKYIRPGMVRMDTTINENMGARLSAFNKPGTNQSTFVLLNDSANALTFTLDLNGSAFGTMRGFQSTEGQVWQSMGNYAANGWLTVTVPAKGILTLTSLPDEPLPTGTGSQFIHVDSLVDAAYDNPLRRAIMLDDLQVVLDLINTPGVDVNAAASNGFTPLHAAAARPYNGAGQIVDALLAKGADLHAVTDEGFNALHMAAMNQPVLFTTDYYMKSNLVLKLINAGIDVNSRDNAGRTPLMWSVLTPSATGPGFNNPFTPFTLATNGADKTLTDSAGKTAYDYALEEYKPSLLTWVSTTGVDTQPPRVRHTSFDVADVVASIVFSEDVTSSLTAADVSVVVAATNTPVTGWTLTQRFSNGLTYATIQFATRPPDGVYRIRINSGAVSDASGNPSTDGINLTFYSLIGDASGDGVVGFNDLITLARNYGQTGRTFHQGDFNGDATVDFDDLLLLAKRYGHRVSGDQIVIP